LRPLSIPHWRCVLTALALSLNTIATADPGPTGILLRFQDQEPGVEPYSSRVMVTEAFVREDFGPDDSTGFLLLDRKAQRVYSVDAEERRILVIGERTPAEESAEPATPPIPLEVRFEDYADPDAPTVAGTAPLLRHYRINGQPCLDVASVPGLLPEARAALGELSRVLAHQRVMTLAQTPRELWDPCVLAKDLFRPELHLQAGFPVAVSDPAGHRRLLLDYETNLALVPELFRLPEGYTRFRLGAAGVEPQPEPAPATRNDRSGPS